MRILFVCTGADIGGAERLLAALGNRLRPEDRTAIAHLLPEGSLSPEFRASFDRVYPLGFSERSRNLPAMVTALHRVVRQEQPDVISSHLFHADLVTALLPSRIPKSSTAHTHGFGSAEPLLTRGIARAVAALSPRFQAVIPSSSDLELAQFLRTYRFQNVTDAIPNGSVLPTFPRYQARSTSFRHLARAHRVKGHSALFAAFARLAPSAPKWTLDAAGPGVLPSNPLMQAALQEAGATELLRAGRIRLHGPTLFPQDFLAPAAALIISSSYGETHPLVGVEASGLGVPVITTEVGSCASFADHPDQIVPASDPAALSQALSRFIALPEQERARRSALARTRAEKHYSIEGMATRYRSVFTRIAAPRSS